MLEIRDNFTRAEPVAGLELIKQELSYRLDRLWLYGADYSRAEWLEWIRDLSTEAVNASEWECDKDHVDEYTHDDCYPAEWVADLVHDETQELKKRIRDLEEELQSKPKRRARTKMPSNPEACRAMFKVVSS